MREPGDDTDVDMVDQKPSSPYRVTMVGRQGMDLTGANVAPTNLDLSKPRGKAMMLKALSPGDVDLDDQGELRFRAIRYAIFNDTVLNQETGELVPAARLVLFDREGRTFRTTAESAAKKLALVLQMYSKEDWDQGIPFFIARRYSPRTKRFYQDITVEVPADEGA